MISVINIWISVMIISTQITERQGTAMYYISTTLFKKNKKQKNTINMVIITIIMENFLFLTDFGDDLIILHYF